MDKLSTEQLNAALSRLRTLAEREYTERQAGRLTSAGEYRAMLLGALVVTAELSGVGHSTLMDCAECNVRRWREAEQAEAAEQRMREAASC